VTQLLRKKGVVGKFVEFFGAGLELLPVADRATIANMAPEYGATCGIFPIDHATTQYLTLTGRPEATTALVEAYAKDQGLWRTAGTPDAAYTDILDLDLATIEPSLAGPKRPQDRVPLAGVKRSFVEALPGMQEGKPAPPSGPTRVAVEREISEGPAGVAPAPPTAHAEVPYALADGAVVIAAITSCTNTSNPSVMIGAGLLAKKAVERGLTSKPWVKTSLAPGSQVVTAYLEKAGLMTPLAITWG
jgi:aconitate hydratase